MFLVPVRRGPVMDEDVGEYATNQTWLIPPCSNRRECGVLE